jgi:hypothetical protein
MVAATKELEVYDHAILTKLEYMERGITSLDKKIEKLDTRQWQIIVLLLSYPLGLLIGKLCHIF